MRVPASQPHFLPHSAWQGLPVLTHGVEGVVTGCRGRFWRRAGPGSQGKRDDARDGGWGRTACGVGGKESMRLTPSVGLMQPGQQNGSAVQGDGEKLAGPMSSFALLDLAKGINHPILAMKRCPTQKED